MEMGGRKDKKWFCIWAAELLSSLWLLFLSASETSGFRGRQSLNGRGRGERSHISKKIETRIRKKNPKHSIESRLVSFCFLLLFP